MHITRIEAKNYLMLEDVEITFPETARGRAGWFVFAGANGSGKTTLLRGVLLSLDQPYTPTGWPQVVGGKGTLFHADWRKCTDDSVFRKIRLQYPDTISEHDRSLTSGTCGATWIRGDTVHILRSPWERLLGIDEDPVSLIGFSVSAFGVHRRPGGLPEQQQKLVGTLPRAARNYTLFFPDGCIDNSNKWLLQEEAAGKADAVQSIVSILQDGLLDDSIQSIDYDRGEFTLTDIRGKQFPLILASDGIRGLVALVLDIMAGICQAFHGNVEFSDDKRAILNSGIVIIDEPDSHLHPEWQIRLPNWFRTHFPNIQFIVATHSPFVCQDAEMIWRMDSYDGKVTVSPLSQDTMDGIRSGAIWNLLQSDAFRIYDTSAVSLQPDREEYRELYNRNLRGQLDAEERERMLQLREKLAVRFPEAHIAKTGLHPDLAKLLGQ